MGGGPGNKIGEAVALFCYCQLEKWGKSFSCTRPQGRHGTLGSGEFWAGCHSPGCPTAHESPAAAVLQLRSIQASCPSSGTTACSDHGRYTGDFKHGSLALYCAPHSEGCSGGRATGSSSLCNQSLRQLAMCLVGTLYCTFQQLTGDTLRRSSA